MVFVVTAALMLATAASAIAANFTGRTSQDTKFRLETTKEGVAREVRLRWRAPCDDGDSYFRSGGGFLRPMDVQRKGYFRDSDPYVERDEGGWRYRVLVKIRGRHVAKDRWSGVFQGWVRIFRYGELKTLCRSGVVRWTARRAS